MDRVRSGKKSKSYKVGYGRPPVATQWKPGQSGNPRGRPKGRKSSETIFEEVLNRKVTIEDNRGRKQKVLILEAIIFASARRALQGDLKAAQFLLANEPTTNRHEEILREIDETKTPSSATETYLRLIAASKKRSE